MLRPILKISIRNGSRSFSTAKNIVNECHTLRKSIQQLNDKCRGPLASNTQKNTVMPFVFLLGNHSSGKSSFVNYILQRKVQSSGVAPTVSALCAWIFAFVCAFLLILVIYQYMCVG